MKDDICNDKYFYSMCLNPCLKIHIYLTKIRCKHFMKKKKRKKKLDIRYFYVVSKKT